MTGLWVTDPVSWWPCHEYITALIEEFGIDPGRRLPYAGTAGWRDLDDGDPAKKISIMMAADHAVCRLEAEQVAKTAAVKALGGPVPLVDEFDQPVGVTSWRAIGAEYQRREKFRESNPWALRGVTA